MTGDKERGQQKTENETKTIGERGGKGGAEVEECHSADHVEETPMGEVILRMDKNTTGAMERPETKSTGATEVTKRGEVVPEAMVLSEEHGTRQVECFSLLMLVDAEGTHTWVIGEVQEVT
ncbi:hypothetical protein NDU88_001852 [Pleurodeles waltl]|uniref:Uncharacterized protein n=1 Tax=Pleurodeles waltl TaxID=8319 RepID=A0AAV7TJF7_PLEWA|nr:hypothetical protein NDU88_001852 [Pleurodeles waltl]